MTTRMLVSYGLLLTVIGMNTVLVIVIARLLVRVRSKWMNDARTYQLPFTGSGWIPEEPVYVQLAGAQHTNSNTIRPDQAVVSERVPRDERATTSFHVSDAIPSGALLGGAASRAGRYQHLHAVTVIMLASGPPERVEDYLRALRQAQGQLGLQIVCVCPGGASRYRRIIETYGGEILIQRAGSSFARCVNRGFRKATQPLVMILSPVFQPVTLVYLDAMVKALQEHPNLAAIGYGDKGSIGESEVDNIRNDNRPLDGPFFVFRRELLESVGSFDERLLTAEVSLADWFWRARKMGYKWGVIGQPTMGVERPGPTDIESVDCRADEAIFLRKWSIQADSPIAWTAERPLVSVVITAHNCEAWIDRCLRSVFDSALVDYEVICVDDHSTDSTPAIIRHWSRLLPITMARFSKSDNVAVAKNRALRMAKGRYIALLDADDEMPTERIPFLLEAVRQSRSDLVYGGFEVRPAHGVDYVDARFEPAIAWDSQGYARLETNWVVLSATLFHRHILDSGIFMDESLPAHEDWEWVLAVDEAGFSISAAPGPACHIYHRRRASTIERYAWPAIKERLLTRHSRGNSSPLAETEANLHPP